LPVRDPQIRACLITNPRAGRGRIDLDPALAVLRAHGWEIEVRPKKHGGHATKLAQEAVKEGFEVVVGCGGDGTLSEIVDGLVGTDVALGALPGGTANLWAHEVGISLRLETAALQLVGAQRRRVDVGRVVVDDRVEKHFLLMAGVGLDAAIMGRLNKRLKHRIGKAAVGVAALRALPSFRAFPVEIEMDGVHWEGRVDQVVVGNTRRYGGFTNLTADAYADDGRLDVFVAQAAGAVAAGRQIGSILIRQRPTPSAAVLDRAARIAIRTPHVVPLQCDGGSVDLDDLKPGGDGVVYVCEVLARSLTVLVPRTYDGTLFRTGPIARAELGTAARDTSKGGKQLRVVAVGVDTFTAVRLKDDRVVTVAVGARTELQDSDGKTWEVAAFLSTLGEGDLVRVKGKLDEGDGRVRARRIVLMASDATPSSLASTSHSRRRQSF
jgi:YegS/Rv2252/BmrU family lipid kinase